MEPKLVCRTCLTDSRDLIEVFSYSGLQLSLVSKLKQHVKLKVEDTAIYTSMCYKCIDVLNEFDKMVQLAHSTQGFFPNALEGKCRVKSTREGLAKIDPNRVLVDFEEVAVEEEEIKETETLVETVEVVQEEEDDNEEELFGEGEVLQFTVSDEEEEDEGEMVIESAEVQNPPKRQITKRIDSESRPEERDHEDRLILSVISLSCSLCAEECRTFDELKDHCRQNHNIEGSVTCCERTFKRRATLLSHVKLHMDPKPYKCEICGKQYADSRMIKYHMESHIPEEERPFPCDKCNKRFPSKARLQVHLNCHNEDYSFKCEVCSKTFNQKVYLEVHQKVHNPTHMFGCEICNREFKSKESLKLHLQDNHLETPLPKETCSICGNKFKNRMSLRQHLLRHKRADDRYPCNICGKEFKSKKWVTQHQKIIHGPPQFKCTECDKEFKFATFLKEHMAVHTGQFLYKCKFCLREFRSNANYYSHIKAQHPSEWEEERRRKVIEY